MEAAPVRRSGLALLAVVGILGILAVMGTAFVTLSRLERRASQQRVQGTKALLLARSALEDGLARLSAGQEAAYGGEDWDGSGGLNGLEIPAQAYQPAQLDTDFCPAKHALRPSFFVRPAPSNPDPALLQTDGRQRGYSGLLGGASYALKAVPAEGIFINGGDVSAGGEHAGTYDTTLKRILGNLAEEVGLLRTQGEDLVAFRPAGGWKDLSAAPAEMRPYLVVDAWVDRKVIRPNVDPNWDPQPGVLLDIETAAAWAEVKVGQRDATTNPAGPLYNEYDYTTWGFFSATQNIGKAWTNRRAFNTGTSSYAPDFEKDAAGRVVGRAPVSLNWARTKPPVLKALLRDLKGIRLQEEGAPSGDLLGSTPNNGLSRSEGFLGLLPSVTLTPSEASAVASAIGAHADFPTWATEYPDWDRTASFDSWDEFDRFVDLRLTMLSQAQKDLLKANFNPNTASNKFNPGETRYKCLDKSDLTRYSTEFSLRSPSTALSASGRITDASGRVLAERTLSATASAMQVRLTTQSEFCAGNLGNLQVAGDETAFRKPGDAGFLEKSAGTDPTYGSRFPGCSPGLALQTYPEPQWPGAPCPRPAAYDGNLQLATIDTSVATPALSFLAAYDDRYDATFAAGNPVCKLDAGHGPPASSLLGRNPVGSRAVLNQIYPDGCYCETFREPGYEARDNIGNGYYGLSSVWVRPHYRAPAGGASEGYSIFLHLTQLANHPSGGPTAIVDGTQTLQLGVMPGRSWGIFAENRVDPTDDFSECGSFFGTFFSASPKNSFYPHRWYLMTGQWSVLANGSPNFSSFCLNSTSHTSSGISTKYYGLHVMPSHGQPDGGVVPYASTACLTRDTYREDGSVGMPYFYLGMRGITSLVNGPADATLDDLLFTTASTDMGDCADLAAPRFRAGRYSKEDGGADPARDEWTSAPLDLGTGARLLRVDWTLVLPRPREAGVPGMPDQWPAPNRIFYGTGSAPLSGETADAALSLRDSGGALLLSVAGRSGAQAVLQPPGGVLKLGADLRPRLGDNAGAWSKLDAPLLESPVLDDLTVTYTGPAGLRLGAWRAGD